MGNDSKSQILSKIAMGTFLGFILIFVSLSSYVYFSNSSNVAIKIQTDNEVNKEKTAVNEALTKTLVMKNDTIVSFKIQVKKRDSILYKKVEQYEKKLKKIEHEKDSLVNILRNFKQSDIQPISRTKSSNEQ
jgi:hypothetical protein